MKRIFTECIDIVGSCCASFEGEKEYISTGALDGTIINNSKVETITYDNKPSRANLIVKKGDIIFAKMQGTNKVLIIDSENENNIYSTGFYAVKPQKNIISKECLFHLLNSPLFLTEKDKNCSGATQKAITYQGLSKIVLNIPECFEQDLVSNRLEKIINIINFRKQQVNDLDQLIKSRFVEMFGDPITNPMNWQVATIGDIATDVRYGTSRPAVENGKYPYLRMNNLTSDGHINLKNLKYINIPDDELEKCLVKKGDILFNRTNSIELIGKTAVYDLPESMVIAGYIIRVRLDDRLLPEILSQYMNLNGMKKILKGMAKGAVNQANINAKELQSIKVYIPNMSLQHQFADFVKQVDKSKFAIQRSLDETQKLYDALMQEYFG